MPPKNSKSVTGTIFADPTYDVTFKMLFANEKHEDLLISLINSLLNFQGGNEVKKVKILSPELPLELVGQIKTSIDVRCSTKNGEEIFVEMQRQRKNYFLLGPEYHMARIFETYENHKIIFSKIFILVLCIEDLFIREYKLDNDTLYEKTMVPMIMELNEKMPGNVMIWKYYEIRKFTKLCDEKRITPTNSLKEQWLSFLDKCGSSTEIPNDVDNIIKKAYKVMETASWPSLIKETYENYLEKETDEINEVQRNISAAKLKGEVIAEISKIKVLIDFGYKTEQILSTLKFLNNDKMKDKLEHNMSYIKSHIQDSDRDICNALGIFDALSDFS